MEGEKEKFLISRSSFRLSRWLFLRGLGLTYFIAFGSLANQVLGLIGSHGLMPATQFLGYYRSRIGLFERISQIPTVFWFIPSDFFLFAGTIVGVIFSILLIANIAPRICCFVLWIGYLSYVSIGGDFLSFQWDTLLLETGFISIFFAPSHFWRSKAGEVEPRISIRFLLIWLLFRLHFESGCGKWLSGDPTWRNLTAMDYYYETAPIPTFLGWLSFHLPHFFHALSVILVGLIEIVLPFYFFASKRWRIVAAIILISFQVIIDLTGNYTFFNLLSCFLCILLIDDDTWIRWIPFLKSLREKLVGSTKSALIQIPKWFRYGFVAAMFLFSTLAWVPINRMIPSCGKVLSYLQRFNVVGNYGLFTMMTTQRWELEIQGSLDGKEWKSYSFLYKPGDLKRRPPFIAPYQPRLDFQCWFLTFDGEGDFRSCEYLISLLKAICRNEPQVMKLLGPNPFPPENPPKYLRLLIHRYQMTSMKEWFDTGCYWKITETKPWSPLIECQKNRK
jgi:hypothetical protein